MIIKVLASLVKFSSYDTEASNEGVLSIVDALLFTYQNKSLQVESKRALADLITSYPKFSETIPKCLPFKKRQSLLGFISEI